MLFSLSRFIGFRRLPKHSELVGAFEQIAYDQRLDAENVLAGARLQKVDGDRVRAGGVRLAFEADHDLSRFARFVAHVTVAIEMLHHGNTFGALQSRRSDVIRWCEKVIDVYEWPIIK